MMGSMISSFCREFGIKPIKTMIVYFSESSEFWRVIEQIEKADESTKPWQRNAHDFLNEKQGEP